MFSNRRKERITDGKSGVKKTGNSRGLLETGILKFICGRYGKRQNDAVIFAGKRVLENERQNDQRGHKLFV